MKFEILIIIKVTRLRMLRIYTMITKTELKRKKKIIRVSLRYKI